MPLTRTRTTKKPAARVVPSRPSKFRVIFPVGQYNTTIDFPTSGEYHVFMAKISEKLLVQAHKLDGNVAYTPGYAPRDGATWLNAESFDEMKEGLCNEHMRLHTKRGGTNLAEISKRVSVTLSYAEGINDKDNKGKKSVKDRKVC